MEVSALGRILNFIQLKVPSEVSQTQNNRVIIYLFISNVMSRALWTLEGNEKVSKEVGQVNIVKTWSVHNLV